MRERRIKVNLDLAPTYTLRRSDGLSLSVVKSADVPDRAGLNVRFGRGRNQLLGGNRRLLRTGNQAEFRSPCLLWSGLTVLLGRAVTTS